MADKNHRENPPVKVYEINRRCKHCTTEKEFSQVIFDKRNAPKSAAGMTGNRFGGSLWINEEIKKLSGGDIVLF